MKGRKPSLFVSFSKYSLLLDPEPHSQYGSGSRTAKSMRIRQPTHNGEAGNALLDPDPHSQYGSGFRTAKSLRIRIRQLTHNGEAGNALLDPDPHSQYGSGSRTAKSMRIRIRQLTHNREAGNALLILWQHGPQLFQGAPVTAVQAEKQHRNTVEISSSIIYWSKGDPTI